LQGGFISLQFLEYLVLFENKIRYTLGILKAYKALNILKSTPK